MSKIVNALISSNEMSMATDTLKQSLNIHNGVLNSSQRMEFAIDENKKNEIDEKNEESSVVSSTVTINSNSSGTSSNTHQTDDSNNNNQCGVIFNEEPEMSENTKNNQLQQPNANESNTLNNNHMKRTVSSTSNGNTSRHANEDNDEDDEEGGDDDDDDGDEYEDDGDDENGNIFYNKLKSIKRRKRVRMQVFPLWTVDEDETLMRKNAELGNDWAKISTFLPGRSRVDVKVRWNSIIGAEKRLWKREDDEKLVNLYKTHNGDWSKITPHFMGRTRNGIRVRFKELKNLTTQPIKAPSLGSAKQIFYNRSHPHFHREFKVFASSSSTSVSTTSNGNGTNTMDTATQNSPAPSSATAASSATNNQSQNEKPTSNGKKSSSAKSPSISEAKLKMESLLDGKELENETTPSIPPKNVNVSLLSSLNSTSPPVRILGMHPSMMQMPMPMGMNVPMIVQVVPPYYQTMNWPGAPMAGLPAMYPMTTPGNSFPGLFAQMAQMQQQPQPSAEIKKPN